ncbi:MAG: PilZ domain-containing protein [Deltaproteobacteria bacterium]|nr:PilZ domain-containing protein [Deltaproteobacteria bacterium]
MEIEKIYLDKKNQGYIICKQCGKTKKIDGSKFQTSKPIKVTCICKNIFYIQLELRQYYRKKVNLAGTFERIHPDKRAMGRITIEDISAGGLGFKTMSGSLLSSDDLLKIKFVLDNAHGSHIEVNAIVRSIREGYVGVEFQKLDEHSRKLIGFYLLS